ncbi:DUF6701 domain-containing protein [Aquipseudomonas ullengensis]|uniref:MSHA biogenesis protein MshQ n=1 Tax=Aquipseudomonas ullengensis TaxID=2759166 RepID=A0A7W4LP63_9GAMM|nr:DUF6701 domain-containing protein [Pseudomonas ullengensis]MBB2496791.1 MSHA biogenesis protein MshQ [Pseudomonas ullengensis]
MTLNTVLQRFLVACALLLLAIQAQGAAYTLPSASFAPCLGGAGNWNQATNTCSGQISFASGDTLTSSSALTLTANGGFALRGNTIGTASNPIILQAAYNPIATIAPHAATTINGSVKNGSAAITLTNVTINGSLETASGSVTLTSSSVSGNVTGTGTGSLTSTNVGGNVSFTNGLSVTGGTLSGTASTNGNASFTNTNVIGAVTATNGITASNSNFSGTITATNGTSSFTGGTINADISGNCCKITISGAYVTGNISSTNELEINNSTITGTISNNNNITFSSSTVYGNVTAASWSTITGTGSSKVYGTCTPSVTSPTTLCDNTPVTACFTDNFDRTSLGSDNWAVTSRNGSFGVPRTVGNRLRLTDNTGNVATGATLQRLLPATGNFVQVQFKYYAYNGNGADGVAVIFSDASVTPQPGGYGGSLGYAQLNGTSGFSGGWAGIALDEYGNFANPTETRVGGPGLRQDSVSVRGSGSGTTGYRYAAGTAANLNPGIDISGSTAGPGHTYRITLDSRVSGRTMVMVERNSGSGFATLVPSFDIRTITGQASLPSDFFLSLTGSTGGSNNIHELDDLQVCATRINPIGAQIDHFEFSYSGTALTCNPQPVTIRACLNSSCSSLYTDPVSVTLNPSSYWSAIAPASVSGSTITFSGGTAQARLGRPTAGTVSLGVQSSVPATKPLSVPVCSTSGCQISYANSGLLLQVPNMLAAKPTAATLSAVRKADNALQCVPAFANVTRSVSFTSAYSNPSSGTQPVVVNGSNVRGTPVSLNLNFDATGTAPLTVRYDDAGEMKLSARYVGGAGSGDEGLVLDNSDTDDLFVSKPYGLCLQRPAAITGDLSNCNDASCAVFPGGIRAGDSFPLSIRAVGWQADGEALTAAQLCSGNITTPNFRHDGISLTSAVVVPSGGDNGVVTPLNYNHALGNTTLSTPSVSEVGVFTVTATPPSQGYLDGETVSGGSSDLVGRFIPAYLSVEGNASLTPSCGSAFSYQGQPMGYANDRQPTLTVTAKNRSDGVTKNYDRGAFWKLAAPGVGTYSSNTGSPARDARLATQLEQAGVEALRQVVGADNGDGTRTYRWTGEQLLYQPALLPSSDDYPFAAQVRQTFLAASLREVDQLQEVCYGTGGGCQDFSYDFTVDAANNLGSEVRLGRLRIGNAHGSELQSLALPVSLESWQNIAGGSFQAEGLDTCTTSAVLGVPALDGYTGNLAVGETTPTSTAPSVGIGSLLLSSPGSGNDGSVQARYSLMPSWLYFAWDGITRSEARGLASFGIYRGATPLIYRREVYR